MPAFVVTASLDIDRDARVSPVCVDDYSARQFILMAPG